MGGIHDNGKTIELVEQNESLGPAVATQDVTEMGQVRLTADPADVSGNPAISELSPGGTVGREREADAIDEGSADRAAP
jgi:hypothetical protein